MRWQHCIDHADTYSKAGRLTRLSSRRSSAADRQSVKLYYNWVSVARRRAKAKLIMLYRSTNNLVDVTTSALTAATTCTGGNTHRYLQPSTRIEAYKHYFFPSTIKTWNKCTQQLVSKQSLDTFRRHLHSMPT